MKTKEEKAQFIELRAKGLSFNKISEELRISKPTLLKWNRELRKEISNLEFLQVQSLFEQYKISSRRKIETCTKKLDEIYAAVDEKNVSSLTIKELIQLKTFFEKELESEKVKYNFYTGESQDIDYLNFDLFEKTTEEIVLKL